MKKKYSIDRVYHSRGKFLNFGPLQIIVETNSPVYNVKWMFDRRRVLHKCPKCGGHLTGEHIDCRYNHKQDRFFLISRCLTCYSKPPDTVSIEVLKNEKHFDIFKAVDEGDY
ncbi:hypothetical protein DRH27_03875 [Candidatus Falkowbacteria bacterium]|nr:MAG: hypothetical protein DRH27_03875 [Candidatus Falkowbacteria bacterium]